jgi:hypothetical protein
LNKLSKAAETSSVFDFDAVAVGDLFVATTFGAGD